MDNFIAIFIGLLLSIMIQFNKVLSLKIGNYSATVLIHLVGLIGVMALIVLTKRKFKFKRGIPIVYYSGGAIGVLTVLFTNISVSGIGISLTVAIGLLGQSIISLIIDTFGLFGVDKRKFDFKKLIAFIIILSGIIIMTFF